MSPSLRCKVLVWIHKKKMQESNLSHSYEMTWGEQTTPIIAIIAALTASVLKCCRVDFFFSDVLFVRLPMWTSHREINMEGRFTGNTKIVCECGVCVHRWLTTWVPGPLQQFITRKLFFFSLSLGCVNHLSGLGAEQMTFQ